MFQNDLYTFNDQSELDDNVLDDQLFCNINDDKSIILDNEIHNSASSVISSSSFTIKI